MIGIIETMLVLALIGFLLWLIITYIPMPEPFPKVIVVVTIVIIILWILNNLVGSTLGRIR
jgi:hypothetical protein